MAQVSTPEARLSNAIIERTATVAVVGLGFVGLTEAVALAEKGYRVLGLDIDDALVQNINAGKSINGHASLENLADTVSAGTLRAAQDPALLREADVVILCVPTPIREGQAALEAVDDAARAIARTADRPKLVILASTVPPGTTRSVVGAALESEGKKIGKDFYLAMSPERIDLGNSKYGLANTPRLVGGVTQACTELAVALYSAIIEEVHAVSSPEVAEASKIFENVFRMVNIGLVNEFAILCRSLGIAPWEVLEAAATKPFGFLKHLPGAGVGGACIPIAPYYLLPLAWNADTPRGLLEASIQINDIMPEYVAHRVTQLAGESGSHILIVGVTYKPGVADVRESPAGPLIAALQQQDYRVSYWDPLAPTFSVNGETLHSLTWEAVPRDIACAVIVTPHEGVNYRELCAKVPIVFDTRNALAHLGAPNVVPL